MTFNEMECSVCGACSVKMWRPYNSFNIKLYCVDCALKNQNKSFEVRESGYHNHYDEYDWPANDSCEIGWLVPAIPTDDDYDAYWGYTSVPQNKFEKWKNLPLRQNNDSASNQ